MHYLKSSAFLTVIFNLAVGSILDYIPLGKSLFSNSISEEAETSNDFSSQKVLYEVAVIDEKFIEQAAKYTGVSLSELDKCQHRVVLKLQHECQNLNDEELAKLAVALLNCQTSVEGRKTFPCTDTMTIRECTGNMDPDTWNSYLLMSNRARAVCYSVRQAHFRGLTELTVNKLMSSAQEQLHSLSRLKDGQSKLTQTTSDTLDLISQGHRDLKLQQQDLQRAQLQGQLSIEDNIQRLAQEKTLITQSHEQLSSLTRDMMDHLKRASHQLDSQSSQHQTNHEQLLKDLSHIQEQSQMIVERIEASSRYLLQYSEQAVQQYEATLRQLAAVNNTVHSLAGVVESTRQNINSQLGWLASALGDTDEALGRVWLCVSHVTYLLIAMTACSFLQAPIEPRISLVILVPTNLAVSLYGNHELTISFPVITVFLIAVAFLAISVKVTVKYYLKSAPQVTAIDSSENKLEKEQEDVDRESEVTKPYGWDRESFMSNVTPPLSRSGTPPVRYRCGALTRQRTPCKGLPLPGRDFCHRHRTGSSIVL